MNLKHRFSRGAFVLSVLSNENQQFKYVTDLNEEQQSMSDVFASNIIPHLLMQGRI